MSKEKKSTHHNYKEIILQLGDLIYITNPVNDILNEHTFFIDYIDKTKAFLINADTLKKIKLKISENGVLGDGNISKIEILSRADSPGYAEQQGLLPGKWLNVHFGGDYPTIITGKITNLEDDMIEVTTKDKEVIYFNFDYKGVPEEYSIDRFEIREKPAEPHIEKVVEDVEEEEKEDVEEEKEDVEEEKEDVEEDQEQVEDEEEEQQKRNKKRNIVIPNLNKETHVVQMQEIGQMPETKNQYREFIIKADQIVFDDEFLGPVVQYTDVSSKMQRYSIETQVSDLLDDLLSTIPTNQRTPKVLNNIHIMIERFKQLREKFSTFDKYGNVTGKITKESTYKPLANWLNDFNVNLYWILPVVKNVKKIYYETEFELNLPDVISLIMNETLLNMDDLLDYYKATNFPVDVNKYAAYQSDISQYFRPFNYVDEETSSNVIIEKEVNSNIAAVVDNLDNFYSNVFSNNNMQNKRFAITNYNVGDTKLDTVDSTSAKITTIRVKITKNELMSIRSIMTLPEPTIRFSRINLPGTDILTIANLNQVFLNYWKL